MLSILGAARAMACAAILIWLFTTGRQCGSAAATQHNILFVIVDDLPVHVFPMLDPGHPIRQAKVDFTPAVRELAAESLLFHRAYSQYAACNPSRASLLTSRTPLELQLFTKYSPLKMKSFPAKTSLPQVFKKSHYVMGTGKLYHHDWSTQFNRFIRTSTGDKDCAGRSSACVLTEKALVDARVATNAVGMLQRYTRSGSARPWFLLVGFHRPHWKYSTTREAITETSKANDEIARQTTASGDALDPPNSHNRVPVFAASSSSLADDSDLKRFDPNLDVSREESARTPRTRSQTRRVLRHGDVVDVSRRDRNLQGGSDKILASGIQNRQDVFSSAQWMDKCLGRLLDTIRARADWNKTIVVFMADHGVMMMDRAESGKSVLFDRAKHVPLIIRHPDFPLSHGRVAGAPVELLDIFPTLAESENVSPGVRLTGQSIMPLIRLFNSKSLSDNKLYPLGLKLGGITIETRCFRGAQTVSPPTAQIKSGDMIACHQIQSAGPSRADLFGVSIKTADWNYIEWRAAIITSGKTVEPRWDANGLWGRELYDYRDDNGLIGMNGVKFESINRAPCSTKCFPRPAAAPIATGSPSKSFSLANDRAGTDYSPPDLDDLSPEISDVVARLALVLRSAVRDRTPICLGRGTADPATGTCDQCIPGWRGRTCNETTFDELGALKVNT